MINNFLSSGRLIKFYFICNVYIFRFFIKNYSIQIFLEFYGQIKRCHRNHQKVENLLEWRYSPNLLFNHKHREFNPNSFCFEEKFQKIELHFNGNICLFVLSLNIIAHNIFDSYVWFVWLRGWSINITQYAIQS